MGFPTTQDDLQRIGSKSAKIILSKSYNYFQKYDLSFIHCQLNIFFMELPDKNGILKLKVQMLVVQSSKDIFSFVYISIYYSVFVHMMILFTIKLCQRRIFFFA